MIPRRMQAAGAEAALGLGMLFGISGSFTESTMWLDRALGSATGSEPWYDAARSMRAMPFTLSGEGDKALSLFRDLPEQAGDGAAGQDRLRHLPRPGQALDR